MLFADVSLSTEMILLIVGGVSTVWLVLTGAISLLFWKLIASKDEQNAKTVAMYEAQLKDAEARIKSEQSEKKSYKEMFAEAITVVEDSANQKRRGQGKPPFKPMAPIIPEHSSPVTQEQQDTADLQTARARLTAAAVILELAPREAPALETDEERAKRLLEEGLSLPAKTPTPASIGPAALDQVKADIEELKQNQVRDDIAEVKADVAEVPEKTAQRIADGEAK